MSRFTATDKLFRQVILKERPNKCEWCGKVVPVFVCHILPKGMYQKLRYQRTNVLLLCYYCHMERAHKSPIDFYEWLTVYKDKELINSLRILDLALPRVDLKLTAICLKEDLK